MLSTRASTRLCSKQAAAQLSRVTLLQASVHPHPTGFGTAYVYRAIAVNSPRHFSSTPASRLKDIFPAKETEHIRTTSPTWPHPGYTEEEMLAVVPGHRKPESWGDWTAWKLVGFARKCMDLATGMKPEQKTDKKNPTTAIVADKPLTESQWVRLTAKSIPL